MSFPISNAAVIRGATQLAGEVANRVSQAVGFNDVLRGAEDTGQTGELDFKSLLKKLSADLRERIEGLGIGVETNHGVNISVHAGGKFRVDSNHPRAAEIESVLNADKKLVKAGHELVQAGGPTAITIDPADIDKSAAVAGGRGLTSGSVVGNILNAPGGYPNW